MKILINALFMSFFMIQNIFTNYLHTWLYAKTVRSVEQELRSSLVRKLQQLSISYHNEMQSGRLQSKIMRDVEQIETLSSQIFISVLSILLNIIVAFGVVIFKSLTVFLFSWTIRDNITYGMNHISDELMNQVVKAANLEELIASLPEGLDTQITEHGNSLSGGQRQRISIARAFVRNPRILILDEATSALDTISEKKIQEAIHNLVQNRTTLIVAHRLSTIRDADRIAVVGNGGIKEFGTYEELMALKDEFYRLKNLQI